MFKNWNHSIAQKGTSTCLMGNQRTGLTLGRPRGEHRGSYSSRCLGCQWHLPPAKSRAIEEMQLFFISWAQPEITQSRPCSQWWQYSAGLRRDLGHYLPPFHSTSAFPFNAAILLSTEIFCVPSPSLSGLKVEFSWVSFFCAHNKRNMKGC